MKVVFTLAANQKRSRRFGRCNLWIAGWGGDRKTLKEVNHKRMREAVTDRALEFPVLLPLRSYCSLCAFRKQKEQNGIRNKPETSPINWATVCPNTQQALKAKRCVWKSWEGLSRQHRDIFTRGPQKPWFKGPIPSFLQHTQGSTSTY